MKNYGLDGIVNEAGGLVSPSMIDLDTFRMEKGVGEIYITLEAAGLLHHVKKKEGKCDSSSERFRSRGNHAFVSSKDDLEALRLYTKAIGFATIGGKEISVAYANRSAVTFALQEYDDSIKDINRALGGNYPDHLTYKLVERRGKCFLALHQYQKAVNDFKEVKKLALNSKLTPDKLNSLSSHVDMLLQQCQGKEDCHKSLDDENKCPRLSHSPSTYIQCASSAVDIMFSEQMGRNVVASTDIYPGDVLAIERPYASVLLPSSYTLFCDCCKKRCHSSVPCLYCTTIMFCNETCRQKSWSSHHSIECDLLPSLIEMGCDKMEFLAVRTLLIATKCGTEFLKFIESFPINPPSQTDSCDSPTMKGFVNNQYLSDNYRSTHDLETNRECRSLDDMLRRGTIAANILHVLKDGTDFFKFCESPAWTGEEVYICKLSEVSDLCVAHLTVGDLILMYLMSAPCNAHEIAEMRVWPTDGEWETESTEIGGAIYPFHSLINHSCDPNVVRHAYNGDTVVLTSIQLIKKGEQVFDNYGYHHAVHDLQTRREHLKTQYCFTCECTACVNDWPLYHSLPEGPPSYLSSGCEKTVEESLRKFNTVLANIKKGIITDENFQYLIKNLAILHQHIERPWKKYNKFQEAIKQCLSLKANHYIHKKTT